MPAEFWILQYENIKETFWNLLNQGIENNFSFLSSPY